MLDRASTFADPEIVELLRTKFIPVAIDQAYQRRQKDAEGEFYRKIAGRGPRSDFQNTTQGLYIATAAGELLVFNNNRGPKRIRKLMKEALASFHPPETVAIAAGERDARYSPRPPEGGLVVRVRARILDGYGETDDPWKRIFHSAISRDNLWITRAEHVALAGGEFPASLQRRISRFHLVDNTRGEPPMWREEEIRRSEWKLAEGSWSGRVELRTKDDQRGYDAELRGEVTVVDGTVTGFDFVARGSFWGEGRYTGGAPEGRFPLAISFSLADGADTADAIPPQGSRGWVRGYLE